MKWLREAISDGRTKKASIKRVALFIAVNALSIAAVILAASAYIGRDVALALGAVAGPLAGLAGYGYVRGKVAEANQSKEAP